MLVSLERKNNPLPESEKIFLFPLKASSCFIMLFKACVLLDQFSNKLCKKIYPQVEADLKMQTNMHLRYPGGTFLRSLPGIAANLSEVIHEPLRKSKSGLKSRAPDWHDPRTLPGAGFVTPSTCPVLNSNGQIQQLGGLRTASHISMGRESHIGLQERRVCFLNSTRIQVPHVIGKSLKERHNFIRT